MLAVACGQRVKSFLPGLYPTYHIATTLCVNDKVSDLTKVWCSTRLYLRPFVVLLIHAAQLCMLGTIVSFSHCYFILPFLVIELTFPPSTPWNAPPEVYQLPSRSNPNYPNMNNNLITGIKQSFTGLMVVKLESGCDVLSVQVWIIADKVAGYPLESSGTVCHRLGVKPMQPKGLSWDFGIGVSLSIIVHRKSMPELCLPLKRVPKAN